MTLETLAQMLKDCPNKSVTMQYDVRSNRYVVAVEADLSSEDCPPEITRSISLIQALQVASEALVKEG